MFAKVGGLVGRYYKELLYGLKAKGKLLAGEEEDDGEAEEEDDGLDALRALVEGVKVDTGGVSDGDGGDVAAGAVTVAIHGWEEVEVDVGGGEDHDGGKEELHLIAAAGAHGSLGEQNGGDGEEGRAADDANEVKDAEGGADDEAGLMGAGQRVEGRGGEDEGKEEQAADPGDNRKELDEAEKSRHRR